MKKLFFFTTNYPSIDLLWKTEELEILSKHFDVEVVPFKKDFFKHSAKKFGAITYHEALFKFFPKKENRYKLIRVLYSKFAFKFMIEFFRKNIFLSKTKLILWTEAAYKILMLSKNIRLKQILELADENAILYFYWGRETSEILGFYKNIKAKIIVRFHGYDLYEYRSNNYIPFRSKQLKNLDYAVFVSENGERYLKSLYPKINFITKLSRLGTQSHGLAKKSQDNVFRIISCSRVIALKRVDLIAKAIMGLNFEVEWTHIGAGYGFDDLKKNCETTPENIHIKLIGQVSASDVSAYYAEKQLDLFINASTTEGLPVSIMEALAAGIPVLATNAGGTGELIDANVGKLLPVKLNEKILIKHINDFRERYLKDAGKFKNNAFNKFDNLVNFKTNTLSFVSFLENL